MKLLEGYRPEIRKSLPPLVAQRWLTNIGVRMMFTFLPAMARGTGLSVEEMGRVLTLRDLTGVAAPYAGRIADRRGTSRVMLACGTMATVGILLSVFSVVGLVVGMVLMGLGKIGFDVAQNAWIGDEVAYERRGRAFGMLELTWAGAALIGLPLCGILIDRVAWWAAPVALGLLGILVQIRMYQVVERSSVRDVESVVKPTITPALLMTMFGLGSLTMASQLLFVTHGVWLEESHSLSPTRIGSVVVIFGILEAVGTLTTSFVTDRIGKRRSVVSGGLVLVVAATLLSVLKAPSLVVGLVLLAIAFLGFEFSFVSSLPLIAELDPKARAQTVGLFIGFSTLTRALASLVGTMIYVRSGFSATMTLCAASALLGVVLVRLFVSEPDPASAH